MIEFELQRQHAHSHQIGAVNTLEAFGDDRFDPQQISALGRPVPARPGAVFLPGDHHQRRARGLIAHGRVVDRQFLAGRYIEGVATFFAAEHFVANTNIGEGAAHHHFMVAAPRTVGVEVPRFHAFFAQIAPRRAVGLDVAGR